MAARCSKHSFDGAAAQCRSCKEPFCSDCLVYTYGPNKPPFCVPCALVAAGVRRHSNAEKKAMKANKGLEVEISPDAGAPKVLVVEKTRPVVSEKVVTVGTAPPAPEHVEPAASVAAVASEQDAVVGAAARTARSLPLAWVAVVVGLLLLALPMVTNL